MSDTLTIPPARLPGLILRKAGRPGQFVVKNPITGKFFNVGEAEHFLLTQLDGVQTGEAIRSAFEARFQDPLSDDDLQGFIKMVKSRGLIDTEEARQAQQDTEDDDDDDDMASPRASVNSKPWRQNILYFRFSLFDPDRILNWLEPRTRFLFTSAFVVGSGVLICAVAVMMAMNRGDLVSAFGKSMGWETAVLFWVAAVTVTMLHEFAHGLTCKHHGGEVHEIGVLMMFFTPCFYCNVSDAWLIPEKSKRIWVTLAGSYLDLCIWAAASIVWRLTIQDSAVNYIAWVVLTVCGTRIFLNFNPLMKLDGYYMLSDWLEVPNLRRRGQDCWMGMVRWVLWGAKRPEKQHGGKALLVYGFTCWMFTAAFFDVMLIKLCQWLGEMWGLLGLCVAFYAAYEVFKRISRGFFGEELMKMLKSRPKRTTVWAAILVAAPVIMLIGRINDRVGANFQVKPGTRAELRAAVPGFLREVYFDEGDMVPAGAKVARLEVPDLTSQLAQKQAQLVESQANLRRLQAGPRREEVVEQRHKVERATAWRDLAKQDLARAREGLAQEISRLDAQIVQFRAELDYAQQTLAQSELLFNKGVLAGQQLMAERKKLQMRQSQVQQAEAEKRAREAAGTLTFESELARREKELADTKAALALSEAGGRPEEIEAEAARLARLQEELSYLKGMREKEDVYCSVGGLMTTVRLKEKIGQFFEKGVLIGTVEDIDDLEVEIAMSEQDVAGVEVGQDVELKARALSSQTFKARVDRIAPAAVSAAGDVQSKLAVYCKVDNITGDLRSGMTGFGRVYRGTKPIGMVFGGKLLRYIRTEFWW